MTKFIPRQYSIERLIGKGKFGICYKVLDTFNEDKVKVIKQITYDLENYPNEKKFISDTENEIKAMYKLDHPFIIGLFDFFVKSEQRHFFIVMEYCENGDLETYLNDLNKRKQILPEDELLNWFVQLLSGLKYIHSKNMIHRDLKPANIMITKSPYSDRKILKIGDLGWSVKLAHTISLAKTPKAGTLSYYSPELFGKNEQNNNSNTGKYDNKTDIWSLGCVLFQMCTGDVLFTGQTNVEIEKKILKGELLEIKNTTEELRLIFEKMMMLDSYKRPSAKDILNQPFLKKHLENLIKQELMKTGIKSIKNISLLAVALDDDETKVISTEENKDNEEKVDSNGEQDSEMEKFANRLSKWKIKKQENIIALTETNMRMDIENWLRRSGGLSKNLEELISKLKESQEWLSKFRENITQYVGN